MRTAPVTRHAPTGIALHRVPRRSADRFRSAALLVGVLGALVCSVVPAGAATTTSKSGDRVTFGIEPAQVGGAPVRSNFSFAGTPGATVNDAVALLNYSSTPLTLQLYATDALETTGGGFGLLPAAAKPSGVGAWISLPPGSSTVQVPAHHVGGVVVSLQTVGTNASGQRVVLDQRVGTRVFVRVAGTLTPRLTVTELHASYDGTFNPVGRGQVHVTYVVSNRGDTDLAINQSVTVSGLVADSRSAAGPKISLLLPGASVSEQITVPGLWPQILLHTTVHARPLAEPGTSLSGLVTASASIWVWAVPWTLIVIILVLLAGYWWYRRRRRQRTVSVNAVLSAAPLQPVGVSR